MPDMEHAHAQFEFDIAAGCSQALGPSHHIIAKCLIAGDKDESRRQAGPPDRHKVEKRQRLASESRRASCFRTLDVGVAVSRQFAIAVYPTSGTRQPHATRCRPPSGVRSASCRQGALPTSPASAGHRANFNDRLVREHIGRRRFDDVPKRPRYYPSITATSSEVAVAAKISDGPRVAHWYLSRRPMVLFGYADDLPLSGAITGRGRWPLLGTKLTCRAVVDTSAVEGKADVRSITSDVRTAGGCHVPEKLHQRRGACFRGVKLRHGNGSKQR